MENITLEFREIGCGGMDWIDLAAVEGSYEHGNQHL
jgi:hypothetical protein